MRKLAVSILAVGLWGGAVLPQAFAQETAAADEVADNRVCQRYVQSYERSARIPQGLMAAISFVESGREGADGTVVAWPWTINAAGMPRYFGNKEEAVRETRRLLDEGVRSIDVGCMQINLRYHPDAFRTLEEAFDPASNVAYAAKLLTELHRLQGSWPKAVERYHSGEGNQREVYRDKVMVIWRDDARRMIMNAVAAEDTDTPYHKALKDYAKGNYLAALKRYDGILAGDEADRTALLGRAMTLVKLGRVDDALDAYAALYAIEPDNGAYLDRLLSLMQEGSDEQAYARLTSLVDRGAVSPALLSSLSMIADRTGRGDKAFGFMAAAAKLDPQSAYYQLNAGILADRLGRKSAAITYYSSFLALFSRTPVALDVKVEDIRKRVHYLRAQAAG